MTTKALFQSIQMESRRKSIYDGWSVKPVPFSPQRGIILPECWQDDKDAQECNLCHVKFTMFKRRHHCRRCGRIYCYTCCPVSPTEEDIDSRLCLVCQKCLDVRELAPLDVLTFVDNNTPNVRHDNIILAELCGILSYLSLKPDLQTKILLSHNLNTYLNLLVTIGESQLEEQTRYLLLQLFAFLINFASRPNESVFLKLKNINVIGKVNKYIDSRYDMAVREMAVWCMRVMIQGIELEAAFYENDVESLLNNLDSLVYSSADNARLNAVALLSKMLRANEAQLPKAIANHRIFQSLLKVSRLSAPIDVSEETACFALDCIKYVARSSLRISWIIVDNYRAELVGSLDSSSNLTVARVLLLFACMKQLVTNGDELSSLRRRDISNDDPVTLGEIVGIIDIATLYRVILDTKDSVRVSLIEETFGLLTAYADSGVVFSTNAPEILDEIAYIQVGPSAQRVRSYLAQREHA